MSNGFYFSVPFANTGDQSTIPWTGTEGGTINYTYGYGSNYSQSLQTNPSALAVDRQTFNNLLYSVTLSLQGLYQQGLPSFITTAENQSVAYSYGAAALCYGPDGFDYYSLAGNNTAMPGTDPSKWQLFNPSWLANKGLVPLAGVAGGTYNFAPVGTGCTLTYTVSGGVINAVTAVAAGGTGFAVGDLLTPNGGNYDAVIRVTGVSGGVVSSVAILYGGTAFAAGTAVATQRARSRQQKLVLTGTLTSAVTFILPAGAYLTDAASWIVANNTTGNFTITFKVSDGAGGSTGTGVVIGQGSNDSRSTIINTDGATDVWFAVPPSGTSNVTLTSSPTATQPNTCYYTNAGSLITVPLPTNPQDGDEFQVIGAGAGGWQTSQITGQQVVFGNMQTTSGASGSLASTNKNDNFKAKFNAGLSLWFVTSSIGNITVV